MARVVAKEVRVNLKTIQDLINGLVRAGAITLELKGAELRIYHREPEEIWAEADEE